MMYIQTDDKRFVKDKRTNAILNIDEAGYQAFKKEREQALRQQRLEQTVGKMESELATIKQMLQQLINGNTNGNRNI